MASEVLSEIEEVRDHLVEYLSAQSDMDGAKVKSRKTADLQNEIMRDLDRLGLSILVLIPSAMPRKIMGARVSIDADIIIRITENVLFNRKKTGKSALYYASRVVALLNGYRPPLTYCGEFLPRDPGLREINILKDPTKGQEDEDEYCAWDALFTAQIAIQPRTTT